jgi:1-deoxy-D-xylulose-5-phosphate reductoisomerase
MEGAVDMVRSIAILGATGSVGKQTLDVLGAHRETFRVRVLTAYSRALELSPAIRQFAPELVVVRDAAQAARLSAEFPRLEIAYGEEDLQRAAGAGCDVVVNALTGAMGIRPTLAAIEAGSDVALANKETLVAAGELVMTAARSAGAQILPVDSEHSAIAQCLRGYTREEAGRLLITASGGPFRGRTGDGLRAVTVEDALAHPNWVMGRKITIDSATLMNKGLEVIEAHHLFDFDYDDIEVLVHPQSIVHSLVEFRDGSLLAQLGTPDMRLPIQFALFADATRPPVRYSKLSLADIAALTFARPDLDTFPALRLARDCGIGGGTLPAVLNAANEVAVHGFLDRRIGFLDIVDTVKRVLDRHERIAHPSLEHLLAADEWARGQAEAFVEERGRH